MKQKTSTAARYLNKQSAVLAFLCVAVAFGIGIKSSPSLQTIASLEAEGTRPSGDINGDTVVTMQDAIELLEIVRGYKEPTPEQLKADPNNDGRLTIDDAIRMLYDLQLSGNR